jgi:hypothetical protein
MMGLFDWVKNAAKSDSGKTDVSTVSPEKGESAEIAGLDFKDAISAHQKWKVRLQACIDGTSREQLDPAVVRRDDQCVLGKWINGPGAKEFGGMSVFPRLKTEHAQFHLIAGQVLSAAYGGQKAAAEETLTSFSQSSIRVQQHLANLFLEAKQ